MQIPARRIGGPSFADEGARGVDDEYDHGEIVAQCRVRVKHGDTVESLSARVLKREHAFLVETLQAIASGQIRLGALRSAPLCCP